MKNRMGRVVFFGSPDFAIPSLEALLGTAYQPVLVVTQPDRRSARKGKPSPTPVRVAARNNNLPVITADSFRKDDLLERLRGIKPDFFVVVAFGLIFPPEALEIPEKASVNVHASLLPAYRGASPVNHAILRGEQFTGVTTMEMSESLDQGPMYVQRAVPIHPTEDAGSLFGRLAGLGGELLLETLRGLELETMEPVPQPEEGASKAPLLKKEDGEIEWDENSITVHNHIRGMNPWPGSFTYHNGNYIKIHRAEPADILPRRARPGTVMDVEGGSIRVGCGRGSININTLQLESRKVLPADDFIKGYHLNKGDLLGRR